MAASGAGIYGKLQNLEGRILLISQSSKGQRLRAALDLPALARCSQRDRNRRPPKRVPAGALHVCLPGDRGLLVDAGLAPVAHTAREHLLQFAPLRIAELDRTKIAPSERLQLALEDVAGVRSSGRRTSAFGRDDLLAASLIGPVLHTTVYADVLNICGLVANDAL